MGSYQGSAFHAFLFVCVFFFFFFLGGAVYGVQDDVLRHQVC